MRKLTISKRSKKAAKYALWLQGGDTVLTDPSYYNLTLELITSHTDLTQFQVDQILSIGLSKNKSEIFILKGPYTYIKSICDTLRHNLIACELRACHPE